MSGWFLFFAQMLFFLLGAWYFLRSGSRRKGGRDSISMEENEREMEKLDDRELTELMAKERAEQFKDLMSQMIGQAIEENNEKLSQDISRMVNDKVLKEIDYLMRVADERE